MTHSTAGTPEEMAKIGASFAALAKPGNIFGLTGTLGTGKTQWAKGFVAALDPTATVSSPTFPIVNGYSGGITPIFHFDFYRLKSAAELLALGWDEYLDQEGITICEWADMFPELMPEETIWIRISHLPDGGRSIVRTSRPEGAQPISS
ncbi:tRNA (adenosine(37)-N6)-threonylcarbamoyltransferase complex ATPase subunit type 1 TsaE [Akkermansiaceae bacterium]|nr:tRNA (adenosine(37)-N6)-threonylcarbamoyltransferase complex ATPase subunit type 1 TsaE [Akkermansiaceae bacterium]